MSWRGIISGGGLAGLVYTLGGMASALLVGLPEEFGRFGVEPTAGAALLHTGLRFGLGLASVAIYAGMRGGFGPGPFTAVRAGALIWFIGYVPGSVVLHELGVLDSGQLAFALAWGLAEAVSATLAGAWLYRDKPGDRTRRTGDGS